MPEETNKKSQDKPAAKPGSDVGLRVSLIPAEEGRKIDPQAGFRKFLLIVAGGLVLFAGYAGYLGYRYYSAKQEIKGLAAEAEKYRNQSAQLGESLKTAQMTQNRLKAVAGLLTGQRVASPLFDFLEKHTLANVAFSGLLVTEAGTVSLAVDASSFESYAAQIDELKKQKEIKGVTASGLNIKYDENHRLAGVGFNLTMAFDPSFFKPASQ